MNREDFEKRDCDFDIDYMKIYINIPAKKKLKSLEENYLFFYKAAPKETKDLWEELKHLKLEELD